MDLLETLSNLTGTIIGVAADVIRSTGEEPADDKLRAVRDAACDYLISVFKATTIQ